MGWEWNCPCIEKMNLSPFSPLNKWHGTNQKTAEVLFMAMAPLLSAIVDDHIIKTITAMNNGIFDFENALKHFS